MDVFISYSFSEQEEAYDLLRVLERLCGSTNSGSRVWMRDEGGCGGQSLVPLTSDYDVDCLLRMRDANPIFLLLWSALEESATAARGAQAMAQTQEALKRLLIVGEVFKKLNAVCVRCEEFNANGWINDFWNDAGRIDCRFENSRAASAMFVDAGPQYRSDATLVRGFGVPIYAEQLRAGQSITRLLRLIGNPPWHAWNMSTRLGALLSYCKRMSGAPIIDWQKAVLAMALAQPVEVVKRIVPAWHRHWDRCAPFREIQSDLMTDALRVGGERQHYSIPMACLISVLRITDVILERNARKKTPRVSKFKRSPNNVGWLKRHRGKGRVRIPSERDDPFPLETVTQLLRGTEGALCASEALKQRVAALVRKRSTALPAISAQLSDQDTVFSLYRGFELPGSLSGNGSCG